MKKNCSIKIINYDSKGEAEVFEDDYDEEDFCKKQEEAN